MVNDGYLPCLAKSTSCMFEKLSRTIQKILKVDHSWQIWKKQNTQQSVDLNNLLRRYAKILFTDAKWFGRQSLASLKMSSALDSKYQPPGRCKRLHPKWLEQYVDWKKSKPFWVGWKYSHLQLLHRNCFGHSSDFTLTDVPWVFFVQALNKLGHQLAEPMTALGIHHGTIERYLRQFSPWNFQNKTWKKNRSIS